MNSNDALILLRAVPPNQVGRVLRAVSLECCEAICAAVGKPVKDGSLFSRRHLISLIKLGLKQQ